MSNASFIGFTGTPIEKTDANTRAVFGDYISIYGIQRAVTDKATVPIYYESRRPIPLADHGKDFDLFHAAGFPLARNSASLQRPKTLPPPAEDPPRRLKRFAKLRRFKLPE